MAASQLAICNWALSHLGIATELQDIAERSKEAAACRRFYDQVIEETLRDFPWGWATAMGTLALVATAPTVEWGYSYRMPVDALLFRRVLNGVTRIDTECTRIPFRIAQDSSGQLIYCDLADAEGEWTSAVTEPGRFPADFAQTAALYLAGMIAPRVTKGDDYKLGDRALKLYYARRDAAWSNDAGQAAPDQPGDDSFTAARR